MEPILYAVYFILGLLFGSFLNVVILRMPQDETLRGRSHCPSCKQTLKGWQLVPLFSYIFLFGQCANCKKKISPRYPTVEFLTGVLFCLTYYFFPPQTAYEYLILVKYLVLLCVFLVVAIIDFEHFLILDEVLLYPGIFILFLLLIIDVFITGNWFSLTGELAFGLISGIAAAAPLFFIWYFSEGRWMGFGDVKYAFFLGLTLSWPKIGVAWFLSFFLGTLVSLPLLFFGKKTLQSKLPFGVFLSLGALISLFYGDQIFNWYINFLGF